MPKSIVAVGLDGHPSMLPRVASAVLKDRGIEARPFTISGQIPSDVPLAPSFNNDKAWGSLAEELKGLSAEAILLPAIVGLQDYYRLDQLEERCGRKVLEAVTPLSAPGIRLADLMRSKMAEVGVTLWDGRKVTALEMGGDTVNGATVTGGMDSHKITVDAVIVATGGPLVDGLVLKEREMSDPFGKFRVVRSDDPFKGGYDSVNGMLVTIDGRTMTNVVGAGDCLSSGSRGYGTGLTEALDSAYLAVRTLEEA